MIARKNIILKICSHTLYASSAKHNEQRPMRHDNSEHQRAPKTSNETHLSHVRGRVTGKARKKAKAAGSAKQDSNTVPVDVSLKAGRHAET